MDTQLYLRVRGRVLGPYDQEKLQSLVRRGQLSRMHEVSTDGTHWVQASTYAELFAGGSARLPAPEMQVAAAPAPQQPRSDPMTVAPVDEAVTPAVATAPAAAAAAIPVATLAAGRNWYYESQGAQNGPVDESVLRQMLRTGQLDANSLVWTDGMPQWSAAAQVPSLVPPAVVPRATAGRHHGSDGNLESLCTTAKASRPWALFLAITASVYAGLCIILGFVLVVRSADRGIAPGIATGLFSMVTGVVTAAGGIILASYANRLGAMTHSHPHKALEGALERLKTFWVFVSIVLIVTLAFIAFIAIWVFAIGVSFAGYIP